MKALLVAATATLGALASMAWATPGHASAAPPVGFAALPTGHLPADLDASAAPGRLNPGEISATVATDADDGPPARRAAGLMVSAPEAGCLSVGAYDHVAQAFLPKADDAVKAVRSERIALRGSVAVLEVVDAWADGKTSAVRDVARGEIPLAVLARAPGEFAVYGFRDGERVWIVVPTHETMSYFAAGATEMLSSSCGLARVPLDTASAQGDLATFFGTVDLVPPPAQTWWTPEGAVARRQRSIRVSVSTSRLSRDAAPLLSVVLAWTSDPVETGPGANTDPRPVREGMD